jgi:hypothetical protein
MSLGSDPGRGVIYASVPFSAQSKAMVLDPRSVVSAPDGLAAVIDADLAREYLRAWLAWQGSAPQPGALAGAILGLVARRPELGRPEVGPGATHRVTLQSGRFYDDPDEDMLYQLFVELETGAELYLIVHRAADPTGETFVHALRDDDGSYILEQRAGGPITQIGTVKPSLPWAHLAVCDWLFKGWDVNRVRPEHSTWAV